jgi:hypothetical protein
MNRRVGDKETQMVLDEYSVKIDEIDQLHVVLVIRALRLLVLGRTFEEAQRLARAAILSRAGRTTRSQDLAAVRPAIA